MSRRNEWEKDRDHDRQAWAEAQIAAAKQSWKWAGLVIAFAAVCFIGLVCYLWGYTVGLSK